MAGGTPTMGASSDNWEFVATPDGYYQIRSVNSNRCLAVYSEDTPNSETHVSTIPATRWSPTRAPMRARSSPPRLRATMRRVTPEVGRRTRRRRLPSA